MKVDFEVNCVKKPVWSCAFLDTGDFVLSGSNDKTCKLFDLNAQKCKQTLRGHVDSVNQVTFQPFSNIACSASGDKTVSLWDIRTGLCLQTFYGHMNACNFVSFNKRVKPRFNFALTSCVIG